MPPWTWWMAALDVAPRGTYGVRWHLYDVTSYQQYSTSSSTHNLPVTGVACLPRHIGAIGLRPTIRVTSSHRQRPPIPTTLQSSLSLSRRPKVGTGHWWVLVLRGRALEWQSSASGWACMLPASAPWCCAVRTASERAGSCRSSDKRPHCPLPHAKALLCRCLPP